MASGRQVEYSLKLNSNAASVLNQDAAAANKFDNSMWQAQKTLASFGIGLGAHFLTDAAKDWIQGAADYETAMLRIRNASKEGVGIFNTDFINSQVDKFKTKLQETSDAYGNFLFKIKNANLSNDVANRLFENLGVVGKVGGIPQEQMDATVRNVGILLGEGVLEARHLRALSYVHPQIVPYLAEALGLKDGAKSDLSSLLNKDISDETAQQQLSQLISSGKLTKAALNSSVILDAFEKYRLSIEDKLPETIETVQSHLNNLSNTWERFKNSLVLGQKPELIDFFHSLENGIKWLVDNEENIISVGKTIIGLAEAFVTWKLALVALEAPLAILGFLKNQQTELTDIVSKWSAVLGLSKEAEVLNTAAVSAAVLANNAETESIIAKEVAIVSMKETLAELNIQQELFTVSQISNTASVEKLKDEWTQLDLFASTAAEAGAFTGFGTRSKGSTHGLHDRYRTVVDEFGSSNVADIKQGELFSDAVMMSMTALQNAEHKYEKSGPDLSIIEGEGALGLLESGGALAELGVFATEATFVGGALLVGLTAASIYALTEYDRQDHLGTLESNNRIKELMSGSEKILGDLLEYTTKYDVMGLEDRGAKKAGISTIAGVSIDDQNFSVLDLLDIKEKKTNQDLPFFPGSNKATAKIQTLNKSLSDTEKHKLRGNSSNFFTVNIHEMNGMKNPVFKNTDEKTMEEVKTIVGIEMTRNMLQVINDIQVIRNGH